MKKFFCFLGLFAFSMLSGISVELEVGIEEDAQEVPREEKIRALEETIYLLQRDERRYRLWERHYRREAQQVLGRNIQTYHRKIAEARRNRRLVKKTQQEIWRLEEQRDHLGRF